MSGVKARSSGYYQGKQSDDDFQRHNANRHHREGSGQDRFRQQAVQDDGGHGQWVNEKDVRPVKTTNRGEKLFRVV